MKTTTIKILSALVLFLGLNKTVFAQCSINASFTYTTTDSSISVTSTSTGTTTPYQYHWYFSGGENLDYPGDSSITYSSLYNGTYGVGLTVSDTLGICSDTASHLITISGGINPPPCVASFTYTIGSAGQVAFTNTSPADPYGNTSYGWFIDSTFNLYGSNQTFYYNGTYTITLSASNVVDGCSTSSSQTISITNANPLPACNANFTYTVGTGGQVSFTSLYTGTAANIQYGWNYGDGSSADVDSTGFVPSAVSHTYLYNGTYTVTASVKDSTANCNSTTTQTISITNGETPPPCAASFSYAIGSAGFVSFTNTSPVDTSHNTSYSWSFDAYTGITDTVTYYYNVLTQLL